MGLRQYSSSDTTRRPRRRAVVHLAPPASHGCSSYTLRHQQAQVLRAAGPSVCLRLEICQKYIRAYRATNIGTPAGFTEADGLAAYCAECNIIIDATSLSSIYFT